MGDQNPKAPKRTFKYLGILTCLYLTFILVSDITAAKLIDVFSVPVSISVIYFPFTFIFSDILTEVYGYARARAVLWTVMLCSITATLLYLMIVSIPPSEVFELNEAYNQVLGLVPRVVVGSWIAIFAGDIANNFVMAKMKIWTKGKMLWLRAIGSTVVGQLIDTVLFYIIALGGILPADQMFYGILMGWGLKTLVESVCVPLTYLVVNFLKKSEGIDYYDTDTNFNPLIVKLPF